MVGVGPVLARGVHRHVGCGGLGDELVLPSAVGHAHEQVQPGAVLHHLDLVSHGLLEGCQQGRVLAPVLRLHAPHVAVPRAIGHEAGEHLLVQPRHWRVGGGEGLAPLSQQRLGQHEVVDAQGRRERLRERAHVDDAPALVHGGQGRQRALAVACIW